MELLWSPLKLTGAVLTTRISAIHIQTWVLWTSLHKTRANLKPCKKPQTWTEPSLFLRVGKYLINCLIFTFLIFSIFSWEKKGIKHFVVFLLAWLKLRGIRGNLMRKFDLARFPIDFPSQKTQIHLDRLWTNIQTSACLLEMKIQMFW